MKELPTIQPTVYIKGWSEERTLLRKMAAIMDEVKYIQKNGYNSFHKYKYTTEADVNDKCQDELAKHSIVMIPSVINREMRETTTRSNNVEYIVAVDMLFHFLDADTGEMLIVSMSGEGQDSGDKAIYKAISGCQKYALMKVFMIASGDDPEEANATKDPNTGMNVAKPPTPPVKPDTKPSGTPVQPTNKNLISPAQEKMLNARLLQTGYKKENKAELMEALSTLIGYVVTEIAQIEKNDVTPILNWLDSQR